METITNILFGFSVALAPGNLFACFIGALLGTLIGVLPGLGPVATMSILMPVTLTLSPATALIMFAGIYYGAQYGGSITSILISVPGEASTTMTTLDGYQMTLTGRAGPALAISAIGSFIGGTLSVIGIMFSAAPLARFALKFGPAEYFALIFLALTLVTSLATGSTLKALLMALLGMLVGVIGMDNATGIPRFTFGIKSFHDGIGLIPVIMGIFGIGELLANAETKVELDAAAMKLKIGKLFPSIQDWTQSRWAIVRGTIIGFFCGILPGGGALISSFAAYALEKKISRHPERFGHGAIEGVAGPETANNAAAESSLIPMLSLGIPSNPVMAVFIGVLMIHGVKPGPFLVSEHPDIFWGLITSMYMGNIMLLILNLPLVGLWVQILKIPFKFLSPTILLFCLLGVYTINNNPIDIFVMIFFGLIGYLMKKFGFEPAPFVMGQVLSLLLEDAFRQSLKLSSGELSVFFMRPISAVMMILGALVLASNAFPWVQKRIQVITSP
jgi:putative tricarboxylic transport membrane protein